MTDVKPTQDLIVENVRLLIKVAQSFTEEVPELKKAIEDLSNKVNKFEFNIEGQNRNIDIFNVSINEINLKVNELCNLVPKVNEEILKVRQDYNNSLSSIRTNVSSFENSGNLLSSAVSRIDREIGDLAKSSEVNNIISAAINKTQLDLTNTLVSKSDLDRLKLDIEIKIQSAENNARIQFFGLLATLILGFLGVMFTIYSTANQSVKENQKANIPSTEKLQNQPANLVKPSRPNQ
ncbi:hypothetical protein [Nostoc sp. CALU 1950]|uniref:hypothetical protein n=1 Tax=Nostoc sp. CALU 1950 TaxID=3104321 RepID=UPI003EBF50F8